MARSPILMPGI